MSKSGNFFALLEKKLSAAGDAPAFETADGAILTFAQLLDEVGRSAAALISLGVQPGDCVLAQAEKSLPNVFLYLATLKIGAVFNPLNTAYTAAELEYFIGDAEPTVIVVAPERVADIKRAAKASKVHSIQTMAADGSGTFAALAAKQKPHRKTVARSTDDLASMLYTSGTTGSPRARCSRTATWPPTAGAARCGASGRTTCCSTPCRSSTCTACSSRCTARC